MVTLGVERFAYEISGEEWGDLPGGWSYSEATSVAVDDKDNVYIFNRGEHPMIVLDRNGKFLRSWGEGMFVAPHGVAMGLDDSVFCIDAKGHTVSKYTLEGKLLLSLGVKGNPSRPMSNKPFSGPTHVAVDPRNGEFLVPDGYSNACVHRYTPDGRLLETWGESGTGPGQFSTVHNIATDRDGWIYVCDRENQRVQVFDPSGTYEAQWNDMGPATALYVDKRTSEQLVYVFETFGGIRANYMGLGNWNGLRLGSRISVHDLSGKVLAQLGDQPEGLGAGQFTMPHGIAVDSRGDIYAAEVPWGQFGSKMDPPRRDLRSMRKLVRKV